MRQAISITILIALFFGFTQAQAQSKKSSEEGDTDIYFLGGLGHFTSGGPNTFQFGGGIDHYVYKGLSIGAELSEGVGGGFSNTILSPTVSYHLPVDRSGHFDPFVTGGYSHLFITQGIQDLNTGNIGGGANFWVSKRVGVRFVFDDHISGNVSFIGLRGGIVFNP